MSERPTLGRRRLLRGSAACLAAATAGCVDPRRWRSAPSAGLTADGLEALALSPATTVVRSRSLLGGIFRADIARTDVETRMSLYVGTLLQQGRVTVDGDWNEEDPDSRTVGVVATPSLSVLGRARNPLATRGLEELVGDPLFVDALGCAGIDGVRWERPPVPVGGQATARLLGTTTAIDSFAAVLLTGNGERRSLLLHLARVRESGTTVLVATVQRRRVPDGWDGNDLVGAGGLVSEAQLRARRAYAADVTPYVSVTNPVLATGGAEAESTDSTIDREPGSYRSRGRC